MDVNVRHLEIDNLSRIRLLTAMIKVAVTA